MWGEERGCACAAVDHCQRRTSAHPSAFVDRCRRRRSARPCAAIDRCLGTPSAAAVDGRAQVHRHAHNFREAQQCTLLSIKTGGCSEDCSYCPQSSGYDTGVKGQKLMTKDAVMQAAQKVSKVHYFLAYPPNVELGFNLSCMRDMGMEVCCTLGMLEKQQAIELKKAGLTAHNHNLDTSREYYPKIITTSSYDEHLETLKHVREAGINVCSGGIIGLGEPEEDRVGLLHTLATLPTHPESVPINALLAVKGTPLQDQKPVEIWEMIRMIATARIVMPKAMETAAVGGTNEERMPSTTTANKQTSLTAAAGGTDEERMPSTTTANKQTSIHLERLNNLDACQIA
ncbi:Biotin synthase [Citrus sinensis]|uniref:Biotin synthase n=1 Tax=Citrus sinensis TaxID=2711 RepID=A0ACB8MDN9_CITSI|nr:Biotin synthase [Citrus sinensis]